jgi:cytochrome c peroxidase
MRRARQSNRALRFLGLTIVAVIAAVGLASEAFDAQASSTADFKLRETCPPSFELTLKGTCKLRTMYELYSSVQGKGLGGTQTALPSQRDGFSPEQIDLGRYLFFDPALSEDGTISCASCHQPDMGFSDGLPRSIGIGGREVSRAAPTLWNVAFLKSFFWDAHAKTLEEQMLGPLYAPDEMGNTPEQLLATLESDADYRQIFAQAFPERSEEGIQLSEVYLSLTAFQTSLISLNSRYDRYAHGYHAALTPREIEGMNVFRSFVARCAECHTPPLFTNQQVAVIGAPEPDGRTLDIGAEKTFNAPKLKAGFKVPTLRNISRTAPYMHSGLFDTLRDTVEFYNKGRGHAIPEGVDLYLHWHISSPDLSDYELDRLVDFLGTLTDESLTPQIPERVPSGLTPITHKPSKQIAANALNTGEEL